MLAYTVQSTQDPSYSHVVWRRVGALVLWKRTLYLRQGCTVLKPRYGRACEDLSHRDIGLLQISPHSNMCQLLLVSTGQSYLPVLSAVRNLLRIVSLMARRSRPELIACSLNPSPCKSSASSGSTASAQFFWSNIGTKVPRYFTLCGFRSWIFTSLLARLARWSGGTKLWPIEALSEQADDSQGTNLCVVRENLTLSWLPKVGSRVALESSATANESASTQTRFRFNQSSVNLETLRSPEVEFLKKSDIVSTSTEGQQRPR